MTHTSAFATADARELPLAAGGTVDIYLTSGNVRLRGSDDERVVVRALDGEPLGEDVSLEAEALVVRIREAQGSWKLGPFNVSSRRSRDLGIDVPRTAVVALRTLSGDVDASGIGADSRWATASGDLRVSVEGGRVQLETMSGDAVLEASAAMALTARTVSGDLRVRAPELDVLELSTTSGDIRVEGDLKAASGHVINSVSGDVELLTRSAVRLQVETIAGEVHAVGRHRSEGARGRRSIVVGEGSIPVSVRTTSGDVRLRALGGAAAASVATPPTAPVAPRQPAATTAPTPPAAPTPPTAPKPAPAVGAAPSRVSAGAPAPTELTGPAPTAGGTAG